MLIPHKNLYRYAKPFCMKELKKKPKRKFALKLLQSAMSSVSSRFSSPIVDTQWHHSISIVMGDLIMGA